MDKCLLIPDRELTTDQSIDTTQVQLGEPMIFIGVFRSKNDPKAAASSKLTPAWVTLKKVRNLKLNAQLADRSTVSFRKIRWSELHLGLLICCLGGPAGLCFLPVALVLSEPLLGSSSLLDGISQ